MTFYKLSKVASTFFAFFLSLFPLIRMYQTLFRNFVYSFLLLVPFLFTFLSFSFYFQFPLYNNVLQQCLRFCRFLKRSTRWRFFLSDFPFMFSFKFLELLWYPLWEAIPFWKLCWYFLKYLPASRSFVNFLVCIKGLTVISFNNFKSFCWVHFIFMRKVIISKKN